MIFSLNGHYSELEGGEKWISKTWNAMEKGSHLRPFRGIIPQQLRIIFLKVWS